MIDIIGHVAYCSIALGTALIALRYGRLGWALRLAGSLCWIWIGTVLDLSSIWFWESVFVGIDVLGLYRACAVR